jgi:GAF domain-containing protein
MAWLRILSGPQEGQTFRLTEAPLTVGRAPTNPIQALDESVSRRHATFRWVGRAHQVADLNSDNGVFLNGNRVQEALLRHDDRVRVGAIEFVYEATPGLEYPVDYTRLHKEARAQIVRGETKGVSLEDIRALLADAEPGPPAPGQPAAAAARPSSAAPGAAPATAPASSGAEDLRARQREHISQVLRRKLAEGVDPVRFTDLVVTGLARAVGPDRGAVLLKQGRQEVLKPVQTWQRPDLPADAALPPLLRDIVLETVRTRRPLAVATGTILQTAGSVPRQSGFAALCAPIISRGTLVGAIYADNALRPGLDFSVEDLRFALELASTLALVVA